VWQLNCLLLCEFEQSQNLRDFDVVEIVVVSPVVTVCAAQHVCPPVIPPWRQSFIPISFSLFKQTVLQIPPFSEQEFDIVVVVLGQGQSPMQAAPQVLTLKQPRPLLVSQIQQLLDAEVVVSEHVPKQHFMLVFWQL